MRDRNDPPRRRAPRRGGGFGEVGYDERNAALDQADGEAGGYGQGGWTHGEARWGEAGRMDFGDEVAFDRGPSPGHGHYGHDEGWDRGSVHGAIFGDEVRRGGRGGGHAGRGPRGWRRADVRICDDVCQRLADDWDVDARGIEVVVEQGEVRLRGTVDSRRARRRAEDLAADVGGVQDVLNELRVVEPGRA